jgi:hypothetical protein
VAIPDEYHAADIGSAESQDIGMAGVEIKGFQELVRNCNYLSKVVLETALQAAEDAAAETVTQAVKSAAPRKSGQLAESIDVFEGIDRTALTGSSRRRLLIGPGKKMGYYGFFLEKGWTWSKGRRSREAAARNTHSQSGRSEGTHRIPPHQWFPDSAKIEARAYAAGEAAFMAVIESELSRLG